MPTPRPRAVFLDLVTRVADERWDELPELYAESTHVAHPFDPFRAPPIRSRSELREHFTPGPDLVRVRRRAEQIRVHETTDPEVVVAEFEYRGTVVDSGVPYAVPAVFVLRVRDGLIVESRDYFDHLTATRLVGPAAPLVALLSTRPHIAGPDREGQGS